MIFQDTVISHLSLNDLFALLQKAYISLDLLLQISVGHFQFLDSQSLLLCDAFHLGQLVLRQVMLPLYIRLHLALVEHVDAALLVVLVPKSMV
jgi:hypothetical protein